MRVRQRLLVTASVSVALLMVLSGCTTTSTSSSGSRHKLYESMTDLIEDTGRVVAGSVASQTETVEHEMTLTISTFEIETEFRPKSLGVELDERALPENALGPLPVQQPGASETIEVRQYGSAATLATLAPLLVPGEKYLLFVNLSGLEGAAASQFYVTGSDAGIYRETGVPSEFERVSTETGDVLPTVITEADLAP
jgi:hypothetical protein